MIGRTMQKIEKVIAEFKAEHIPDVEKNAKPKNMDFNEPSNVEKDFQSVHSTTNTTLAHAQNSRKT